MRLRTFTAPDMPAAMKQVREALGDDAIILSSQAHKGKKGVTVTAAVEQEESPQPPVTSRQLKDSSLETKDSRLTTDLRFDIQETLRFHNIPELFIAKIMNADRGAWQADARHCLKKLLAAYFTFSPLSLTTQYRTQNTLMLIGPPGIGKTLTIARIAAKLALDKQPLLVVTTDNKRAGGVEQLQVFTDILGIPLDVATKPDELHRKLKNAHAFALIDTAGCNPYDAKELKELAAFAAASGIAPVLALPAGGDSLEAIDTVEAFMQLPVKRLLVTRTDTARRFGGVLAAAAAHGLAFCNISSSSSITDPLLPMDEALLAQLLLKYKEHINI